MKLLETNMRRTQLILKWSMDLFILFKKLYGACLEKQEKN